MSSLGLQQAEASTTFLFTFHFHLVLGISDDGLGLLYYFWTMFFQFYMLIQEHVLLGKLMVTK